MKPLAWSYSSLEAFETCPHRYQQTKVLKTIVEPQTESMLWGNRVHKALELRVGKGTPLSKELIQYEPIAASICRKRDIGAKIVCEQKLALNKNFKVTTWFASDVWVRGITDVTIVKGDKAVILDHKTGKPKPGSGQLKLTAAITFATLPYINTITNSFLWLKSGTTTTETFQRDQAPEIWQEFMPRVQRMEEALKQDNWPKRPSGLCKSWCPVHTCEFNGRGSGGS